ncbi:inositol monophosphatase 1-like [Hyalella azteca]|uniref:Inositol-1-monophosphatase n=1 Tax=Hyalella azteca TaxID=294128 RepID=A0A8B7PI75_HYAAZ|nr:inositol monophosphatase 1-like [Hyalella azteca]
MSAEEQQQWFDFALDIAKRAGLVIKDGFEKTKTIEMKDNPRDLVTDTDKAVEALVIGEISKTFPDHKFIGEESTAAGAKCELTDSPTWIIDPVDGTMNFVHSFPYTCISLAVWCEQQPCVAVVHNPILDLTYTARKDHGAFLNGKKLSVSLKDDLSQSLVMTELWCRPDPAKMAVATANAMKVIKKCHGPRCMGSAALNMCHVAQGAAEVYYEIGIHAWDTAAASLIVREAGGVVMDMTGGPYDLMNRRVLCAANLKLAQQMVELLEVYDEDRD